MTPDFLIQFVINRSTDTSYILLTDQTTGATSIKGNFKITYPDGSVVEYTDYASPNISAIGGTFQAPIKNGTNGEVQLGSYEVDYTVVDTIADEIDGNTKTFTFSFDEPELEVVNTSDVAIPRVAFAATFDYTVTDFTETLSTFNITCAFPTTSDANGTTLNKNLTSGDRELLMVDTTSYYEGDYTPTINFSATYQSATYAYLSVLWTDQAVSTKSIYAVLTATEILEQIELFKDQESANEAPYNRAIALFENVKGNVVEGVIDEGNELLSELYDLIGIPPTLPYQSTPIAALILNEGDFSNYYTKAEIDALITSAVVNQGLSESITATVEDDKFGGLDEDEVLAQGTTFTDVIKELVRRASPPTYLDPTLTISGSTLSGGGYVGEVGDNQVVTITPTYTQNDAGASTQFVLDKNGSPVTTDTSSPIPNASYADTIVATEGSFIYDGEITYSQGAVKNDSFGNPFSSGQIAAGTKISNSVRYDIVYPWFYGISANQTLNSADIYGGTKVTEIIGDSIQAAFSGNDTYLWFAVPSSNNNAKTYTNWFSNDDPNNAGEIGGATNLFGTKSVVSVTSTGLDSNYTINYDVYITNYKTDGLTLDLAGADVDFNTIRSGAQNLEDTTGGSVKNIDSASGYFQWENVRIDGSTISNTSNNTDLTLATTGLGNVGVNNRKIINVLDPTTNQDAATKKYVDQKLGREILLVACSDEVTDLTAGTSKVTFRIPFDATIVEVRASVGTAPAGSSIVVDINKNAASILSTKLSIDATEKTSETAATPAVISDTSISDDDEITIDIDQIGSSTAGTGLKVTLIVDRV